MNCGIHIPSKLHVDVIFDLKIKLTWIYDTIIICKLYIYFLLLNGFKLKIGVSLANVCSLKKEFAVLNISNLEKNYAVLCLCKLGKEHTLLNWNRLWK